MKEYRFRNNLKKSIKKIFIMGLVLAFVAGILKDKINVYANTTKVYNNDDIINTINNRGFWHNGGSLAPKFTITY